MWSPDSRRLLFVAGPRLMEWEVNGPSRELWVSPNPLQAASIHWKDGVLAHLAYATANSRSELRELWLDAHGKRAEGPATNFLPLGSVALPQLSPNGRWLTFAWTVANRPSLWVATADGHNPRKLADLIPGSGAHISPDSRQIAFHSVGEIFAPLYVAALDGKTPPRKVAQTQGVSLVGASWSGNGEYLYTMAVNLTPRRVLRARVSEEEVQDLFEGSSPVVSADGRRVFYKKGLASPLFVRSLDGNIASNPEELLIPECVMEFGIVPTRRGIYYVSCDEGAHEVALRYFEFFSRRIFHIGPPPDASQPILTVSRDGRRLLYGTTLYDNDELMHVTFMPAGS
jgi:Tol biopolymer transport system component